MSQVEIAETDLAALVERARGGEEVVLAKGGQAVARLVPVTSASRVHQPVQLGRLEGLYKIPDDFDAPLPDDLLDLFEGRFEAAARYAGADLDAAPDAAPEQSDGRYDH